MKGLYKTVVSLVLCAVLAGTAAAAVPQNCAAANSYDDYLGTIIYRGDLDYCDSGSYVSVIGYNGSGGNIEIPSEINGKPVKRIESDVFSGCTGLTGITIPDSVTSISGCFKGCTGLTEVTIPGSIKYTGSNTFSGCTGLKSVTLLSGVTAIQDGAFSGCTGLKSIIMPDNITGIGNGAFSGCTGLVSVALPGSIMSVSPNAFSGCTGLKSVVIPDRVTLIGANAFYGCKALTELNLPERLVNIGENAFGGCRKLKSISLPDSVASIGSGAFDGCKSLTEIIVGTDNTKFSSVDGILLSKDGTELICCPQGRSGTCVIPGSVTVIDEKAFQNCAALTDVTFADDLTRIGADAFSGCTALTVVNLPESVTSIGEGAFQGCTQLRSIALPSRITSIAEKTFSGCKYLSDVRISDSVTNIGADAFRECAGLCTVSIPSGVTNICANAFFGCTGLQSLVISGNVTSIGSYAFSSCPSLSEAVIPSSVTNIENNAFDGCRSLVIYGSADSEAETFALENNIPFIVLTDGSELIPVGSIELSRSAVNLAVGHSTTVKATVAPADATNRSVAWTSSDESVATVANGKITAVSVGTATVTAKSANGKAASVRVNVKPPVVDVVSVTLSRSSVNLAVGHSTAVKATVSPADATNKSVVWTSSDESVATVENGRITAVSVGTATVTARSANGKTAAVAVNVKV